MTTGALGGYPYLGATLKKKTMSDLPNFAAWSNENLANFAKDAYLRMQAQQNAIEQLQGDFKDAMAELRKHTGNGLNMGYPVAPTLAKGGPRR